MTITQTRLKELFSYHPDGYLVWNKSWGNAKAGERAGRAPRADGYITMKADDKGYLAHRLIFLFHHGYLPAQVDHRDTDRSNNRIDNLRDSSAAKNMHNKSMSSKNKTGFKGVVLSKTEGKWCAGITHQRKKIWLGTFDSPELAHEAYKAKAVELFGDFARFE